MNVRTVLFIGAALVGAIVIPQSAAAFSDTPAHTFEAATFASDACQRSGAPIEVSFKNPVYDPESQSYVVDGLNLENIDAACLGLTVAVTVISGEGSKLADGARTMTDTTVVVEFRSVSAATVSGVAVTIF